MNKSLPGMQRLGIGLALFALCSCLVIDELCPRRHQALLMALLPLHRGSDCRETVQRGIQQRIALETALRSVNAGNQLQIGLKILDTCSSKRKAVESALKGLEFAEKRCSRFPVFLGFLGPDDEESLRALMSVIDYSHVVPSSAKNFHQFNAINLETIDAEDRGRRLMSFLKYLNWHSFVLLFTSDTVSTRIASSLLESDYFCLTNSVLQIPSFGSDENELRAINRLRRAIEEVENVRIVVITDDEDVMRYFTDYVEDEWGDNMEYVVYVQKSGIVPRKPSGIFRKSVILHEVPKSPPILPDFEKILKNSTSWTSYLAGAGLDESASPRLEIERTAPPYAYSLHLYARALKTLTQRKCGSVFICDALRSATQTEWKSILQDTVTFVDNYKIRFFMNLDYDVDVIVYDEEESFVVVGAIDDYLRIYRPENLKRSNRSRTKQCFIDLYEYELEPERELATSTAEANTEPPTVEEKKLQLYFGYNELMATAIGFPIGIVAIVGLTLICVYGSCRSGEGKTNLSGD